MNPHILPILEGTGSPGAALLTLTQDIRCCLVKAPVGIKSMFAYFLLLRDSFVNSGVSYKFLHTLLTGIILAK